MTAAEVHAAVQAPALTTAPGVLEATEAHIAVLLPQLRLIVAQRTACRHRTEALLAELATEEAVDGERNEHRDVQILRSLPGVGRQVAATMLAEASRPLRARDYHTFCGSTSGWRRSPSGVANGSAGRRCGCGGPATSASARRPIIGAG